MKKTFIEPEIKVSKFRFENILTASGTGAAETSAYTEMNTKGIKSGDVTGVKSILDFN